MGVLELGCVSLTEVVLSGRSGHPGTTVHDRAVDGMRREGGSESGEAADFSGGRLLPAATVEVPERRRFH